MGFLGKNGAGKTTTIRLLLGLTKITSGQAWVMGHEVAQGGTGEGVAYMSELPAVDERDTPETALHVIGRFPE